MKTRTTFLRTAAVIVSTLLLSTPLFAAGNHSNYIKDPLKTGPDATKKCLECHNDEALDVMKTSHWTLSAPMTVGGKTVDHGKKNALNNFCGSISGNWARCTSCHIGYGYDSNNFDFKDKTKVDCLVCHDTTATYRKSAAGAGLPDPSLDLLSIAQSVGKPKRENCGACHFFGGGGDAVKHGDMDSSMEYPERNTDVHMDINGPDFQCQSCHETKKHQIGGSAMVVSPTSQQHIGCVNCHDAKPHKDMIVNQHLDRVACQTCHIPFFAKEEPTKTSWDWSQAGQDIKGEKDQYGKETYLKAKGRFTWGKMIVPSYAWYNGTAGAYLAGDKFDPSKVVSLSYPKGSLTDQKSKIYPFKVFTGKQIYDTKNNILITAKVFGEGGYWTTFDWDKAARLGMEASGLPYSGSYGFAATSMYWKLNHMVAPKEQALGCLECHGDKSRLDWKGLGYTGDPLLKRAAAVKK